jgi:hypothetical protein
LKQRYACARDATLTRFASIFGDAREVANVNHVVISERMNCTLAAVVWSAAWWSARVVSGVSSVQRALPRVVMGDAIAVPRAPV